MSVDALKKLYGVNHRALGMNVNGLDHEDSLIQPTGGGNCLNWVAGHIVANRTFILQMLGEEPVWSEPQMEPYKRGSKAIQDGSRAVPFASILADFEKCQDRVQAGLGRLNDEDLARKQGEQTLGDALHFLQFHEAYHIGQIGLLRRMAGKEGAIR
ncbi:MAG: DinB family protein [Candidatus Eiseniibacteriota bacterium]